MVIGLSRTIDFQIIPKSLILGNINGKKVGRWDILQFFSDGGLYNDQGQTNGEWRQLNDELQNYLQVLQNGEYQNGKKIESGIFYLKGKKVKAIH
ncbi:unnamed protein product [Paramecium sonneborni]|uniref:Uncharacterized protein n=1 Tax=Paramecium sonneborni TaxID=65129 RepID=A0A8S1NAG1_9CILI|nr:unnamed protein product [Paramecium sonneborni]